MATNIEMLHADVAIVGAGLVGLAAAVAFQQAGFSVVLVDGRSSAEISSDTQSAVWDNRVYAISPKNAAWLLRLGVWPLLNPKRICEMQVMEIFADGVQPPLALSASDVNESALGFIVEAKSLILALIQQVETLGISTLFGSSVHDLTANANDTILHLDNQQTIACKLLLAADGSHSWVRQQLNMAMQQKSYDQTAIVANFAVEKAHAHIARQWFAQDSNGHNSILAWLPLPDNQISIVWSVANEYANQLLALNEDEFTKAVSMAGNAALGKIKLVSPVAAFPLALQKAHAFVQHSVVLVGDAAHQIHPMAGQGVNLGFRDVIDLLAVIEEKGQYQAINDASLLKRYTRARKVDVMNMLLLTDGLYQLFESQNNVIKKVRHWGLTATKASAIKKMLVANAITL